MKYTKRTVALLLALVLMLGCVIGGTVAYLMDKTEAVVNTFTTSDVDIELNETLPVNRTEKMVPGKVINKDPTVTVKAVSEACWLFVKVDKSANFEDYMTWGIASGWTELPGVAGVYYREVDDTNADQAFDILAGNTVTVKTTVTKTMMDGLTENTYPKMTFTAYAVQKEYVTDAATAWHYAQDANNY